MHFPRQKSHEYILCIPALRKLSLVCFFFFFLKKAAMVCILWQAKKYIPIIKCFYIWHLIKTLTVSIYDSKLSKNLSRLNRLTEVFFKSYMWFSTEEVILFNQFFPTSVLLCHSQASKLFRLLEHRNEYILWFHRLVWERLLNHFRV